MILILIGIVVILLVYIYLIKPYSYWKNKNIPQTDPLFLVGDCLKVVIRKEALAEFVVRMCNRTGKRRYLGFYQMLQPVLLIKDLDLVKQLGVKDFDHFPDHRSFIPDDADPLWEKNLFALKGQNWKDMRSILSPSFTGSKMKMMFLLISECAENMAKYFLSEEDKDMKNIEMKDICSRFANDVIASTAFGIKVDSLAERNNEFYSMGKKATDFTRGLMAIKMLIMFTVPKLAKLFKMKLFSNDSRNFFTNIIKTTIANREKLGITRSDMIQLLLEARKHGLKYEEGNEDVNDGFATVTESHIGKNLKVKPSLTDTDITAQGMLFFLAGFDTVSSGMSFMAYELAVNPDIQERLIQEIDNTAEECEGKLTYEALMGMKYLDMVISETLRKWPPVAAVDRQVSKPYIIQPTRPDENPVVLDKGDVIWIPIYGFHHDPEYYPNPEKFDPERFNDENKHNIKPNTYVPFGVGPRNCIGSRFALLEIKTIFFYLLSHFEIAVTEKTQIPIKMDTKALSLASEKGIWIALKRRTKSQSG